MKTIYIKSFASACAAVLFMTSCTDLDVDIKSQYTSFPNSDEAAEAVTANVYYAMRGPLGRNYHEAQSLSTDEVAGVSMGTDYYDGGAYLRKTEHSWTADNGAGYWGDVMSGITNCNTVLALFGDPDSDISAPVRAVRAYYFWVLMDSYGDVPLITKLLSEGESIDRSPRAEVAEFIESELLAVLDKLPTEVNEANYGKPTRWMAEALLAKLYINWAVYTSSNVADYTPSATNSKLNDVAKYCDDIISSGNFNLTDSYLSKFYPENGYKIKDFIYVMPYDRQNQQGMTYARFWTHRSAQKGFYGVDLPNSVGGNWRMLPEFVDKFCLTGDDRNGQIIGGKLFVRDPNTYLATTTPWTVDGQQVELTKDIKLVTGGESTLDTGNDLTGRSQGYRSIKFYMDLQTTKAQSRNQSNDVPIFRYADILLMKAEAILRGATATNGDTPMSLMNQIRSYVHAPLVTANPTLDELLDERAREFADENWRRNDLIRFGKFEDPWGFKYLNSNNTAKYLRIFPLPTDVLNSNTNWTQNTGY